MLYTYHAFVCTNKRPEGHERGCCAAKEAEKIRNYMKARVKELGLSKIRINTSGCLDQCEKGPAVVIYPEGIFYTLPSLEAAEQVIQEHFIQGKPVTRFLMKHD